VSQEHDLEPAGSEESPRCHDSLDPRSAQRPGPTQMRTRWRDPDGPDDPECSRHGVGRAGRLARARSGRIAGLRAGGDRGGDLACPRGRVPRKQASTQAQASSKQAQAGSTQVQGARCTIASARDGGQSFGRVWTREGVKDSWRDGGQAIVERERECYEGWPERVWDGEEELLRLLGDRVYSTSS
jgi:hypothetical protein